MSGHNRWSKIKHKKEASDAKKSKMWTKVIKEITVAARMGGGDPGGNPRLRAAMDKARAVNMTNDVIERSIKKGTGDLGDVSYEEFAYEVFGPGGSAMLVDIMTDNRNRTVSEVRNILQRGGGHLGASGSVAYMFKKLGVIVFDKSEADENVVTDLAIELGAEDVKSDGDAVTVLTDPKEFERVREGFRNGEKDKKLPAPVSAEVTMVAQTPVRLTGDEAVKAAKLVALLEDNDDVQNVYSNLDVDDAVLESVG